MEFAVSLANIVAALITVLGGYVLLGAFWKWYSRPRLHIGLIPDGNEMKSRGLKRESFGKADPVHEFRFHKSKLAIPLRKLKPPDLATNDIRIRHAMLTNRRTVELSPVIQNLGKRGADRYKLVLTFSSPSIEIVDLHTETLEVDGLYTVSPRDFNNPKWSGKIVSHKLVQRWADFGLPGSYVSLIGSLASDAFEGIFLELKLPEGMREFWLFAAVEYLPDARPCERFAQPVRIE